jgi:mono/diheme cytochrome c family protein
MRLHVVVLAAAGLLAASAALAQDRGTLKAIYEGRALYVVHCSGCHGNDARGAPSGAGVLRTPDLTGVALRDGAFRPVHVANHISGRHDGEGATRTMPLWARYLKEEWPAGDSVGQMKVAWLVDYLAIVQQPVTPQH